MLITVSLLSPILGEIKNFFDKYVQEECNIDNNVVEWIYVYHSPSDALNIIHLFLKHIGEYNLSLWVQVGDEDITEVRNSNKSDIIEKIKDIADRVVV